MLNSWWLLWPHCIAKRYIWSSDQVTTSGFRSGSRKEVPKSLPPKVLGTYDIIHSDWIFHISYHTSSHSNVPNMFMLHVTCISSILANLWFCCLDRRKCENNPLSFQNMNTAKIMTMHCAQPQMSGNIFFALIFLSAPPLSTSSWELVLLCGLVDSLLNVYLTAIHLFARIFLCLPTKKLPLHHVEKKRSEERRVGKEC